MSMYMTAGAQPTTPTSTLTPVPTHLFRVRYYRTGDLGEVFYERGEARIRLVDRCSFAIKMQNSEWLAPSRLEAALENAPSVDQVSQTAAGPPHLCGSAPNAWLRCQPACVPPPVLCYIVEILALPLHLLFSKSRCYVVDILADCVTIFLPPFLLTTRCSCWAHPRTHTRLRSLCQPPTCWPSSRGQPTGATRRRFPHARPACLPTCSSGAATTTSATRPAEWRWRRTAGHRRTVFSPQR